MDIRLLCTDVHSESAKRLADKLTEKLGYKVYRSDKVIPNRQHIRYGDQRDKLHQYKFFRKNNLNFPWFTESKEEVIDYMVAKDVPILCRVLIKGQEGRGIVIADNVNELVDAPVYVEYKEKTLEYRVNLFRGRVINVREKRRKLDHVVGLEDEPRIRNVANGYVYCIPKREIPVGVQRTALGAALVTDSCIVGVDVAYNKNTKEHFLLEVNSAPALEGITVDAYRDAIIKEFE
jgi:hypothetical protein